jgi:hypothetical protein
MSLRYIERIHEADNLVCPYLYAVFDVAWPFRITEPHHIRRHYPEVLREGRYY